MKDIKSIIKELSKKYSSHNPIDLAKSLKIITLYEDLGKINGYCNTAYMQRFIHINNRMPERKKIFTAAHELGHTILHPDLNTLFLKEYTYLLINKYEIEANKFAVNPLIQDDEYNEMVHCGYTNDQLAAYFGIRPELIKLKILP